jgi:hypothetical protein
LHVAITRELLNSYVPISPAETVSRLELAEFDDGAQNSSLFHITAIAVGAADEIEVCFTCSDGFADLVCLSLVWSLCNPGAYRSLHAAQLLLAFMVVDMFIVYTFCLKFDSEKWTQMFLLVLGIAGIIRANPVASLWPDSDFIDRSAFILSSVFIGVYSLFLTMQFHLTNVKTVADDDVTTAVTAVVFAVYAVLDATTEIHRRTRILANVRPEMTLRGESVLMIVDSVCITLSFSELGYTAVRNEGANFRKLVLFAVAIIATNTVTFLTQVWFPLQNIYMDSPFPQLLYLWVHESVVSALLFLLRPEEMQAYKEIGTHDMNEILEVDTEPNKVEDVFEPKVEQL